jgi:hypothetical protein
VSLTKSQAEQFQEGQYLKVLKGQHSQIALDVLGVFLKEKQEAVIASMTRAANPKEAWEILASLRAVQAFVTECEAAIAYGNEAKKNI